MQPCELGIGFEGFQPCHSPVHVLAIYCVDTCHSLALTGVQQDTITHSVHVIRGDKSIALQTIGDTIDGIGAKRHGIVLYRKAGVSQRQVRDYIKKEDLPGEFKSNSNRPVGVLPLEQNCRRVSISGS
jgi:hypothetical protein